MPTVARVAIPVPLRRTFDFLVPAGVASVSPGMRVSVPFGPRDRIGVVVQVATETDVPRHRLKALHRVLDTEPLLPPALWRLIGQAAEYYHHPIGEVLHTALPAALRRGRAMVPQLPLCYGLTAPGRAVDPAILGRAVVQRRILAALGEAGGGLGEGALSQLSPSWRRSLRAVIERGWVSVAPAAADPDRAGETEPESGPALVAAQRQAVDTIVSQLGHFQGLLLYGVTGSGKTEVYLNVIEAVLREGRQALVLVPEIGLTPQLVRRFRERLPGRLAIMHSGLSDADRHAAWWYARQGEAGVVLGTRSAIFAPLARPGVLIVDEEHDSSYKQQDGFRYHARDLAVLRAQLEQVPVILGSATPSLETLANVDRDRYRLLRLPARIGTATLPTIDYVDLRRVPAEGGLSVTLLDAIAHRIDRREQSLIFLNRRGFAPVLFCPACGWQAQCARCDARLTFHRHGQNLRCHHCGHRAPEPQRCPACEHAPLRHLGQGTQRIEELLTARFPQARILRIDRDTTRHRRLLEDKLAQVNDGEADILVGTQMLAKGHDFPRVTLVGVIDADQGLYSIDFRASEYLFQQILQVAGRAGRADRAGEVLIQTMRPDHPHFTALRRHDYSAFSELALMERREAGCPPYAHFALVRAESAKPGAAMAFLAFARARGEALAADSGSDGVQLMDPVPSPMERRAGRHRAQLLAVSGRRAALHRLLRAWIPGIEGAPEARRVRWSLDVDPVDMY